ncbi:MAG: adenosine kinase [Pseudomonadales bacterium]|nr:adenosine kinase [Pseudomonadales bacterium]
MKQYDVFGIGNALVDTEFEVTDTLLQEAALQKGTMTLVEENERQQLLDLLATQHPVVNQSGGGSAANTMVAIAQLGGSSFYCCKVANDATGDFFMSDLQAAGLDTNLAAGRDEGISGQCISMVTPDAERTMTTHLGISQELSESELDEVALRNAKYLYIEGYLVTSPGAFEAALKAQRIMKQAGGIVSLTLSDPMIVENFKTKFDQFAEQGIDLVFCNQDEAMIWTASDTAAEAFLKLQTICPQVAMTCGKNGAMVFDGHASFTVPGIAVNAVDTTGAGDIFAGVFLHAISNQKTFTEAATQANKAAALLVSQFGARLEQKQLLDI